MKKSAVVESLPRPVVPPQSAGPLGQVRRYELGAFCEEKKVNFEKKKS